MLEVSEAVAAEIGADRTGIRISPLTPVDDGSDSNPQPLFDQIVDQLNGLKLLYIHVIEGATGGPRDVAPFDYASLRRRFKQPISLTTVMILNLQPRRSRAAPPT
jgi:N-ethylmaleimide reductase